MSSDVSSSGQPNLTCILCGGELPNPYSRFQPDGGLAFITYGHYGSTIFDPMDGSGLEIAVCDPCVLWALEKGFAVQTPPAAPQPQEMSPDDK
jgi:hypothetical protein